MVPKLDFQSTEALNTLRDRVTRIRGVDEVRMDDSWFARLSSLTGLVGRVSAMIGVLMVAAVFPGDRQQRAPEHLRPPRYH